MGTAPLTATVQSVVDPDAINFVRGIYGTCINGQSFQIDPIATHAGWQYVTYFNAPGHPCLSRRRLPDGPWERIVFDDYRINHTNVHNVSVLGICPGDGTIHLAYDHHGHPLHYRVSRAGAATKPDRAKWGTGLFAGTRGELVRGQPLDKVTYPALFPTPDGKLQFYYRTGGSGDGDSNLAEYDPAAGGWTVLGTFVSRRGSAHGFHSRCAYHNGFTYGPDGRLHTTWCWREHYSSLLTNHDLMYAWSDDAGRTWRNNVGDVIGHTGADPVHLDSPGVVAHPVAFDRGMMNQTTQTVDAAGGVHVVLWHNPPDAAASSENLNAWGYFHYWRDAADGRWTRQPVPFAGRRPVLLSDRAGDLWLVFAAGDDLRYSGRDLGGHLHVARTSAASGWTDWSLAFKSDEQYDGEPRVDRPRWATDGVLSVYAQEHPPEPGNPSPLRVIDFKP